MIWKNLIYKILEESGFSEPAALKQLKEIESELTEKRFVLKT